MVLILIGTRAVLIMKVFSDVEYFHALGFQLLPILDYSPHGITVLNVKSWGGGVEYDMI